MIYVYVDSIRMAYVQRLLDAQTLENISVLKAGDTIIFPVLKKNQRKLPLKNGELLLSTLKGLNLYLPFPYSFINENNNVHYYMQDDVVTMENAKLTAIGMLAYLGSLTISFKDVVIDIIGNGKCGKAINDLLKSQNFNTRVIRRSTDDINIGIEEYKTMDKGEVIINTAPHRMINYDCYEYGNVKYIIDISSERCIRRVDVPEQIEIIYPGSLPNSYSAYSSAVLISDYIKGKENER